MNEGIVYAEGTGLQLTLYLIASALHEIFIGSPRPTPNYEQTQLHLHPTRSRSEVNVGGGLVILQETLTHWLISTSLKITLTLISTLLVSKIVKRILARNRRNKSREETRNSMDKDRGKQGSTDIKITEPNEDGSTPLEDIDVNEVIHEQNMNRAISMLSIISTPPESSSEKLADTFTEEQNLNLDLDIPGSFDSDSIDCFESSNATSHQPNNEEYPEEATSFSVTLATSHCGDKVEQATMATIGASDCQQAPRTRDLQTNSTINVKAAAMLLERKLSLPNVGSQTSSRLPIPKIPTTPRLQRRSLIGCEGDGAVRRQWETFESTTPRKCAVNRTPHMHINAASGDRCVSQGGKGKKTMSHSNVEDKGAEEKRAEATVREAKALFESMSHIEQLEHKEINRSVRGKGNQGGQWSVDGGDDIVSETTEWVVYNE